jgi:hypothetical protein
MNFFFDWQWKVQILDRQLKITLAFLSKVKPSDLQINKTPSCVTIRMQKELKHSR